MYELGKPYNRRGDIHGRYGGQMQGGISTPAGAPFIFLFTGDSGLQFGYEDGWKDGVFAYVGEGQEGDMTFVRGNRAIRDHRENGKELLLFKTLGKGKPVVFMGQFDCAGWEYVDGTDLNRSSRRMILFHLVPVEAADAETGESNGSESTGDSTVPLEELRKRALKAAETTTATDRKTSAQSYRQRSKAVKTYVLARARGLCEACKKPAPFIRRDGTPYLEPHHTKRIADSGPDHPRWVGAICPTCHREIHSGRDGRSRNEQLIKYLGQIEAAPLSPT